MSADPMRPGPATPDADILRGLVERVRAAKGPDRDLDLRIKFTMAAMAIRSGMSPEEVQKAFGGLYDEPEPYTGSPDAALTLVERALPGACIDVAVNAKKDGRRVSCAMISLDDDDIGACWEAATPPLAILAALLTALLAQTEGAPDAER